ncbi:unnamed protein product [Cyprideis torosa]|uniref:Uncharacterized protein n=1 Tax=Cyprideis torosa TaxID=163714 RepID=A0A7R8ZNI6_9CRUS|nr:unnamed protein product [Cyprideis torosa]CAG0887878.1 unnamed protein product [Cyprideis torosa]
MYYNTTIYPDGSHFWVNLSTMQNLRHEVLSESHRRASFVSLPFKFPYYGHYLNNVTIATGGFLYTGAYIHSWLAVTQYIAPLMANFDPSASKDSSINYGSNETTFTVEWTNVTNPDHPDSPPFTFQVSLHKNGDIVFAYKDVPLSAALLRQDSHPVKVGIADAYTIERTVFFIRKKTIFEYHKVDLKDEMFGNSSAIYFKALPTCLMFNDCASCAASEGVKFECSWCEQVKRCSDGVDRFRQDWIFNGCVKTSVSKVEKCDALKGLPIGDGSGTYNIPDPGEDSAFGNRRGWKNKDSSSEEDSDDDNKISRSESFDVKKQTATNEARPFYQLDNHDADGRPRDGGPLLDRTTQDADAVVVAGNQTSTASMAHSGTSGLLTVFFISVAVILLAGWVFYAYRNPQTPSGQFLIRKLPLLPTEPPVPSRQRTLLGGFYSHVKRRGVERMDVGRVPLFLRPSPLKRSFVAAAVICPVVID